MRVGTEITSPLQAAISQDLDLTEEISLTTCCCGIDQGWVSEVHDIGMIDGKCVPIHSTDKTLCIALLVEMRNRWYSCQISDSHAKNVVENRI